MRIESTIETRLLGPVSVVYEDVANLEELNERTINAVHVYCFYKNTLVVVWADDKKYWTLPGGSVEKGETVEEAVIREVKEESNMKVISQRILGVQDIFEGEDIVSQTRSMCIVEPYGPFISDPDGDITKIKRIDPLELKQYVDWGEIGDHLLSRALESLKEK